MATLSNITIAKDRNGIPTGGLQYTSAWSITLAASTVAHLEVPAEAALVVFSFRSSAAVWTLLDKTADTAIAVPGSSFSQDDLDSDPGVRNVNLNLDRNKQVIATNYLHFISSQISEINCKFYKITDTR